MFIYSITNKFDYETRNNLILLLVILIELFYLPIITRRNRASVNLLVGIRPLMLNRIRQDKSRSSSLQNTLPNYILFTSETLPNCIKALGYSMLSLRKQIMDVKSVIVKTQKCTNLSIVSTLSLQSILFTLICVKKITIATILENVIFPKRLES